MRNSEPKDHKDLAAMITALGDAYLERGLFKEAIKKYRKLIELGVEHRHVFTNLSRAYIGLRKADGTALAVYQKAVQYSADNKEIYDTLAKVFLRERREDRAAVKVYKLALANNSPISEPLAKHLAAIHFKQKAFQECKELIETILFKMALDSKILVLYLRSCWSLGSYDEAINHLKRLFDSTNYDGTLLKYLCITYLEKLYHAEAQNAGVKLSFIDRELIAEYLSLCKDFESLQDLCLYLDIKRCFANKTYWKYSDHKQVVEDRSNGHQDQKPANSNGKSAQPDMSNDSALWEVLNMLEAIEPLASDSRSQTGPAPANSDETDKASVLVTLELCRYNTMISQYGHRHAQKLREKLIVIVQEVLQKSQTKQAWATSNALLILASGTKAAVSLSIETLNKLNRYNFQKDSRKAIHIAISIHDMTGHHADDSEPAMTNLSVGVKLAMASDVHLHAEDRAAYARAFNKHDRIFLTGKANDEIQEDNGFKIRPLGKINLKSMKTPTAVHEVTWRNPIDELRFGYIKRLGRFDLISELANKGPMRVFKAKDSSLQRYVILKVIQSETFNSLPLNNRRKVEFYEQVKSQAQMSHPNITNIYEVEEDHGLTYIAREFAEGFPVNQIFRNRTYNPDRLVKVMFQVCKGLQYGHRQG
ncbi:protein kinase, partial [bacterium]|nr:protein kinase [bacterium]